jgi:hypothetical protein
LDSAQQLENCDVSHLSEALAHFETAVRRLETALEHRERNISGERERLGVELRDLRASHATLQAEARMVSTRLDAAIGRLRAALEI